MIYKEKSLNPDLMKLMQIRNTAKNESVFFLNPKPGLFGSAEAQGVPAEAAGAGGQGRRPRCGRSAHFKHFIYRYVLTLQYLGLTVLPKLVIHIGCIADPGSGYRCRSGSMGVGNCKICFIIFPVFDMTN